MYLFLLIMAALFSCSSPDSRRVYLPLGDREPAEDVSKLKPEDDPYFAVAKQFDRLLNNEVAEEEKGKLSEQCQKSPTDNIFCFSILNRDYFDEKVRVRDENLRPSQRHPKRITVKFKKDKLKNWQQLREAPVSSLVKTLSSLSLPKLTKVKEAALNEKSCPNNPSIAVAAVLEDFLPGKVDHQDLAVLYRKGGRCMEQNSADRATMLTRSGLFFFTKKAYAEAKEVFQEASASPNTFVGRSLYWLYRCHQDLKETQQAEKVFETLKERYPFAFHTLVAVTARDEDPGTVLLKHATSQLKRSQQMPLINPLIEQVEILGRLGFEKSAAKVLSWAIAESYGIEPEVKIYLAELKKDTGDYFSKIYLLSEVLYQNPSLVSKETMELYFPKVFFPVFEKQSSLIDPYLLLAIARRESAFNVNAISSANAQGLLQLLPNVKKELKLAKNNLLNPSDNVELGAQYLTMLLKQLRAQIHLALAAYNAGSSRLKVWMERYPMGDPILFIDLIPYRETREYVASILRNYYWYRRIHQGGEGMTPKQFIELAIAQKTDNVVPPGLSGSQ